MAIHETDITINASPEKVFDALTNPEQMKRWQYGREVFTNWKVGSPIRFEAHSEDGVLKQWGTVLDIRQNELVKYNLFTPRPDLEDTLENYSVTSYVLSASGEQTKVDLIQEDNRPSGFTPLTLKPILVALKKNVEETV